MFSERQKIVVIDDNYKEIEPFLKALWKKGISCIYFDGNPENLPVEPFLGVRVIFLDIVIGTEGTSDKNKTAPIANIVNHIIGSTPCPYFIVFWTKHPGLIDEVMRYLESGKISPVGYMDMEKPTSVDSIITTAEILEKLDKKIAELGAFEYLLKWENLIEKASYNFATDLFSVISSKGDQTEWSSQVSSLLGSLALSYTDNVALENNCEDLRNAYLLMTDSLKGNIQQTIKQEELLIESHLSNGTLSLEQIAKLNASLFFDFKPGKTISFGNIFIEKNVNTHLLETLQKDIPLKFAPDVVNIAGIIMTPSCDIANKKILHNGKSCFRILYGLLFEISNINIFKEYKKHKKPDALFLVEPFWILNKQKPFSLVFHFGSLSSLWWGKDEIPEFVFSIKEHLAFDIQSKMANHANRLGNSMLKSK